MERFIRNLQLLGQQNYEKLTQSKVMVIGLGGVGGYAVECLARMGVGSLVLVDFDIIQESNINRQIIACTSTLGMKKIDAFSTRIYGINPNCDITKIDFKVSQNNINLLPKDVDFVVDAVDDLDAKIEIYSFCLRNNINFISSMGMAKRFNPSKVAVKTLNKTEYDPLAKKIRHICREKQIDMKEILTVCSEEKPCELTDLPSIIFVPSKAGILCAFECIKSIIQL